MTWLFPALLANTVVGIVLATLALLASRCGKPALAHVIWLLVVVKLVTPPIVRMIVWNPPPAAGESRSTIIDSTPQIVAAPRQEDAGSTRLSIPSAQVEKVTPAKTIEQSKQVLAQSSVPRESMFR